MLVNRRSESEVPHSTGEGAGLWGAALQSLLRANLRRISSSLLDEG